MKNEKVIEKIDSLCGYLSTQGEPDWAYKIRRLLTDKNLEVVIKPTKPTNCDWTSVKDKLPKEIGRYLCYVEEMSDLGVSHYQWNCSYGYVGKHKTFITDNGGIVTHWMKLPDPPSQSNTTKM